MGLLQQGVWGCLAVFSVVAATTSAALQEDQNGYKFGYTVRADETGDYKTHHEVSDGNGVRGSYSVGEPNGDLRVVTYTADRVNGFRALVKVHPGGSPVKPGGGAKLRSELVVSETDASGRVNEHTGLTTSAFNTPLPLVKVHTGGSLVKPGGGAIVHSELAVGDTDAIGRVNEHTELTTSASSTTLPLYHTGLPLSEKVEVNNITSVKKNESVTLFKVLPALDKHVPKVEYIVEEVFRDEKAEPNSELGNDEGELFEGSQVIPVKIIPDPTDQSPEMVGLDANSDLDQVTTITNEDVIVTNAQETQISNVQNATLNNLMSKEPTLLQQFNVSVTNQDNAKETVSISPPKMYALVINQSEVTDSTELQTNNNAINKPIETHIKLQHTSLDKETPQQQTQNHYPKLTTITMQNTETKKQTPLSTQPTTRLITEEINHAEVPNHVILTALMFPSVLKFTCLPDTMNQDDVKPSPTVPSHISKLTNVTPPQASITSTVIPLYPFQLINFKLQNSPETPPQKSFTMSSKPPLPVYSDFTTIPSTPIVNLRMLPKKPSTGLTPKPTQSFTRSVDHKHQNRHHYPLYPIPPPWTYHSVRPLHSHPRHLPIFVLPMSHNFNFAPTFNPEVLDGHNH